MEEIARFLAEHPPFSLLPHEQLQRIARKMQIEYFPANHSVLIQDGAPAEYLYVLCRGSVDVIQQHEHQSVTLDTMGEGDVFGESSLLHQQPPFATVRTREETLVYMLPGTLFHQLREDSPAFRYYFTASKTERLNQAMSTHRRDAAPELFQMRMGDLVRRQAVTVSPGATIRETAEIMRQHNMSSVLITSNPPGIVSDRDLRNRVVSQGLEYDTPVTEVMTSPVMTMPDDSLVFEGLTLMIEKAIHHLPITRQGKIIGMVTDTDIMRQQGNSPFLLSRQLERAHTRGDLKAYTNQVEATARGLLVSGARIRDIGRVVAIAHDALLKRLLQDAEANLGPPPCPYAWIVAGSEGRLEQTLRTDQDNALIYADDTPPEAEEYFSTEEYFSSLAEQVVEALVQCGFPRCPGNVMASNPTWRQPLHVWQGYFEEWIRKPDEEAILQSSIFFDYRRVYGLLEVEHTLRPIIEAARDQKIFLGRIARNTLRQTAPVGFFRNFVVEKHGADRDLVDLKERGTALVVDIARLYALACGAPVTNTFARLEMAADAGVLSKVSAEELAVAYELISLLRLEHQVAQLDRGEQATNRVPISSLTRLQQRDLKEAFRAISRVQQGIEHTFQTSLFG